MKRQTGASPFPIDCGTMRARRCRIKLTPLEDASYRQHLCASGNCTTVEYRQRTS